MGAFGRPLAVFSAGNHEGRTLSMCDTRFRRRNQVGRVLRAAGSAVALIWLAHSARAQTLDQHNDGPLLGGTSVGVIGAVVNQSAAQTLTVGLSGTLTRVDMYVFAGQGALTAPLTLDITPAGGGSPDSSAVLATQSLIPPPTGLQWVTFDVSGAALTVSAGDQLALVLHSSQDWSIAGQYDGEGSTDVYGGGQSFVRLFSGPWSEIDNYDLMFRTYVIVGGGSCYPNCDGSTSPPILTANDFQCFLNKFAVGDSYANCDHSTAPPTLNANDFQCFLNEFAEGCS